MITFVYLFIFALMISGIVMIDIFLIHKKFEEMFIFIIALEGGTNRWWIVLTLGIGLCIAMFTDFKEHKKKLQKGHENGQ
ncbi:hypothetical protein HHO41_02045 [Bacillus sp. DNRA2]|uniref:hypothetical protein n=1 Tax=Bacillus sp. DNRA2 TaxID=2723053 RepID=UPI00145F7712|nr:hypothetical protein [Bacillus sp. DNRA2]NMD69053.1 hypothetical protein [Bacillus sp. DNRA2]